MQVLFSAPKPLSLAVCLLALPPMVASGANPVSVPAGNVSSPTFKATDFRLILQSPVSTSN